MLLKALLIQLPYAKALNNGETRRSLLPFYSETVSTVNILPLRAHLSGRVHLVDFFEKDIPI